MDESVLEKTHKLIVVWDEAFGRLSVCRLCETWITRRYGAIESTPESICNPAGRGESQSSRISHQ